MIGEAGAGDMIAFNASLETISLTSGAIKIDKSLTIEGPGASQLTIDAGHNSQILTITEGNVSISGLTLADGKAPEETGGAIEDTGSGSLAIADSIFSGNAAGGNGGIAALSGQGHGGAIYVSPSASSLSIGGSTFTGNTAGGEGGTGQASGRGRGGAIDYEGTTAH